MYRIFDHPCNKLGMAEKHTVTEKDHTPKRKREGEEENTSPSKKSRVAETEKRSTFERSLVELSGATLEQLDEFKKITADPSVMKTISKGETWSAQRVDELVAEARKDDKEDVLKRDYFHWLVLAKEEDKDDTPHVVGYVGFHPFRPRKGLQIRVFVSPARCGHGSNAVRLAIEKYYQLGCDRPIWSVVSKANMPSFKLFERLPGWEHKGSQKLYGSSHELFLATPPETK